MMVTKSTPTAKARTNVAIANMTVPADCRTKEKRSCRLRVSSPLMC